MKRAFALFALLGLVGCFLPLAGNFTLFDARHFDAVGVWLIVAAFAVPLLLGLDTKLAAAGSVAAIACFGYILVWRFGWDTKDLIIHGSIGGKAMGFAAIGGFVSSILSLGEAKQA